MATINDTLWQDGRGLLIDRTADDVTIIIVDGNGREHDFAGGVFPTDSVLEALGAVERETADWRNGDRVEVTWDGERIVLGRETVGNYAGYWVTPGGLHCNNDVIARKFPKAVGERETAADESVDQRLVAWDQVADHEFFAPCFREDGPLLDAMLKKLDIVQVHGVCYPAEQRTRHLNHIADVEAALTRRNEQRLEHEARIRELEVAVGRAESAKNAAEAKFHDDPMTARELLELAWDQATVPKDGMIHTGEAFLSKTPDESVASVYSPAATSRPSGTEGSYERRLLDPRPEPTRHPKAQEIEDQLIESIGCGVLTDEELARAADDLAGRCDS